VRIGDFKYRFTDQPNGWFGATVKVDWPILTNLRLDPYERTGLQQSVFAANWWAYQFWRFVFVQDQVGKLAQTATLVWRQRFCGFHHDVQLTIREADHAGAFPGYGITVLLRFSIAAWWSST
jgi:hypothetical protein